MLLVVFQDQFDGHKIVSARQREISRIRRCDLVMEMINNLTLQFNLGMTHKGRTGGTDMDIALTRVTFSK